MNTIKGKLVILLEDGTRIDYDRNKNTGYHNSGCYNSGDYNYGDYNTNQGNCGWANSGRNNNGLHNSGNCNNGNHNTGSFNKTNCSNGVFCNKKPTICLFNKPTNMTITEFYDSKFWVAINSSDFPLTELSEDGVTVKANTYEEACRRWWAGMTAKNKEIIKSMPNFDINIFCDITGIDKSEV